MDLLLKFIDVVRHLDRYLDAITQEYGGWTYAILGVLLIIVILLAVLR